MPEPERDTCPVCGRVIFQPVVEYELGRRGSSPVRWPQRWRHLDDRSLACEEAGDVRAD